MPVAINSFGMSYSIHSLIHPLITFTNPRKYAPLRKTNINRVSAFRDFTTKRRKFFIILGKKFPLRIQGKK